MITGASQMDKLVDKIASWVLERMVLLASLLWRRISPRVPLPEAARLVYEAARRTKSGWELAAMKMNTTPSPEQTLLWVACNIVGHAALWGRRPPSTILERVAPMDATTGKIFEGASMLMPRDGTNNPYVDLMISRWAFWAAIMRVRRDILQQD
jgi:hypothetical protein